MTFDQFLLLLFVCLLYGMNRAGSVSRDREALCAVFDATDKAKQGQNVEVWRRNSVNGNFERREITTLQDGWKRKDGWKSSEPLGQWHGVTTNAEGRVIGLDLHDNDLSGTTT